MNYKLLTISALLAIFPALGMQNPIKKQNPRLHYIDPRIIDYFGTLSRIETELNRLVDQATNYHTTNARISNTIHNNPLLLAKDRHDLQDSFKQKLDAKFFPARK